MRLHTGPGSSVGSVSFSEAGGPKINNCVRPILSRERYPWPLIPEEQNNHMEDPGSVTKHCCPNIFP